MDDLYALIDFSAINGYPHVIPKKALDKLPSFQGNNVVSARSHIESFTHCINKWCGNTHEDVKKTCFSCLLKKILLTDLWT